VQIKEKPIIGCFPCFFSLGETIPQIKISEILKKNGIKCIFFSHGGKFESIAKNIGYNIVKLTDISWEGAYNEFTDSYWKTGKSFEQLLFYPYENGDIECLVKEEIDAFKKYNIDILISSFNLTTSISARVAQVPLIVLQSGTSIPPFFINGCISFPENYENIITRFLPSRVKKYFARWILMNNKLLTKDFNRIAKEFHLASFQTIHDILQGDHTLICDDITFLGIQPNREYPLKNFVGPIFGNINTESSFLDDNILNHINKPGISIFVTMGSTRSDNLFYQVIETLNKTKFNVIVSSPVTEEKYLPSTKENILIKPFIHSPKKLHEKVDLSIIHRGRGTVYTAAYAGKPVIGFPNYMEHQYNIDNLVRNGSGIRLSKKFFKPQDLLQALDQILKNYDIFLKNAKNLSNKLTKIPGEKIASQRILDIYQKTHYPYNL